MEIRELYFLGDRVTEEDLNLISDVVVSCDGLSRMELARTVCELLGWKRRNRSLKGRECREFLEKLDAAGLLVLPDKRAGRPVGSRTSVPVTEGGNPGAVIQATVQYADVVAALMARAPRLFFEDRYARLGQPLLQPAMHLIMPRAGAVTCPDAKLVPGPHAVRHVRHLWAAATSP